MSNTFSLPGIKYIAYMKANTLPAQIALQSLSGLDVIISPRIAYIPINGEPSCECKQTNGQGHFNQSAELSFRTTMQISDAYYVAFLIIDANGNCFLLGTKEDHPLIERIQSFGNPAVAPNTFTYNVQLVAPRALIPCRVL